MRYMLLRKASVEQWQSILDDIYGKRDQRFGAMHILLHLARSIAKGSRILHAHRHVSDWRTNNLPDIFAWLAGYANHQDISLADAVWSKYHGCCPYCGRTHNCECIIVGPDKTSPFSRVENATSPASLREMQQMFKAIYGYTNRVHNDLYSIWMHLMEEAVDELPRARRCGDYDAQREEMADTFAWLMALCNAPEINLSLADAVAERYRQVCPKCKGSPCKC